MGIGELLKLLVFVLLALFFLINTILRAKKTQAVCKLDYLNNVLTQKNILTFVLTKKFMLGTMPKPFPKVREENIGNFSYRSVLNEIDEVDKTMNRANFTLGIVIFILACILGINFPEVVRDIFN